MHKIFVYGSLKRGHGNNSLLKGYKFLGEAQTVSTFKMYDGGFPYVVDDNIPENEYPIKGELFEVDNEGLTRLDRLEGVSHDHYNRIIVDVAIGDAFEDAYMYVASPSTIKHVRENRKFVTPTDGVYCWR